MSIITKLIYKEWLKSFLGSALILTIVLSLGHFLNALLKDSLGLKTIFTTLYLELPTFMVKIFPVSCLIASLFSVNKLKSRNELTAIFASGFSRRAVVVNIAMLGGFVGVVLFYINSYIVTYTKHRQDIIKNPTSTSINALNSGRIWFKGKDNFFSYTSFDSSTNEIAGLTVYIYNPDFKLVEQIRASKAKYIAENKWLLSNVSHYANLSGKNFPTITPSPDLTLVLQETISDFKQINADIRTLAIWRLYNYIEILKNNGINYSEYYVTFLDKFASGFTCLVLSILASIALFNPNRRNSSFGVNVAFVLSFTFIYWFIYSYFLTLGQTSRIPAEIATFGVPSIFVFYLIFYFIYHRKLR